MVLFGNHIELQNISLYMCSDGSCMAVSVPKVAIAVVFVKVVVVAGTFRI